MVLFKRGSDLFIRKKDFSVLVAIVWLGIFAAGFRSVLGVSIIPPYETYIPYEVYIAPGLIAMIQLFNECKVHFQWFMIEKWGV